MESKTIEVKVLRENMIQVDVYGQEFALDRKDARTLVTALIDAGIPYPMREEMREIPATLESIRDPSVVYLEAILQAQAAHLADTRGILELTLNHIFGGRPAPQPTTPGENNV